MVGKSSNARKRIGLYGGSFNPIHNGHLNFACQLREKSGLDEIWFIPTACSPFKKQEELIAPSLRRQMVELAIGGHKEFRLYEEEILRGGCSYTIDTVQTILAHKKEEESFFLCLSEDLLPRFAEWREYRKILSLVPLLVGTREEGSILGSKKLFSEIRCPIAYFKISATEIRARLRQGLYCDHLVPQKVLDFIYENQLYFNE